MTTRLSDRERAIRAKMVARYQHKKQLGSAVSTIGTVGSDKCDVKHNRNDGDGDEIANVENRNTANATTIITDTTAQPRDGICSNRSSGGGAKSMAAAAAAATSRSTTSAEIKSNNVPPPPSAALLEKLAPGKARERASLSDAKRKLAASRMAVAAALPSAPTTPRGGQQQKSSTPKGNRTSSIIMSPRNNHTFTRSFSTSPRHQSKQQQQQLKPLLQSQSTVMTLKAQRERFLRIKQCQPVEALGNRVVPSSPSSFMSVPAVDSLKHPHQTQKEEVKQLLPSIQPIQQVENQNKLHHFLMEREQAAPSSSTELLSTASEFTNTTAKQQLRMQIMYQDCEDSHFDNDLASRGGEENSIFLSGESTQKEPLLHQAPQQHYCQKLEVSPNCVDGPYPINITHASSYSVGSNGDNLDFQFDGDNSNDGELVGGDIIATVSDPPLQLSSSNQSVGSHVGGKTSRDATDIVGDDCDGGNDDCNKRVVQKEIVESKSSTESEGRELLLVSSSLQIQSSVSDSECHIGNVAFGSDRFQDDKGNTPSTDSASFHRRPIDDDADDFFAFKKYENNEFMKDQSLMQDDYEKNPGYSTTEGVVGKDNDVFGDAWPEDSFSPTAWGAPQSEFAESSSDQWNAHFSQSKSSSSEASGQNDGASTFVHQNSQQTKSEEQQIIPVEACSANMSLDGDAVGVDTNNEELMVWNASDSTSENHDAANEQQLQDEINADRRISCEDRKVDSSEQGDNNIMVDWKSTTSSTAYVGFGGVLNSCQASCTESRDDDDEVDVNDVFLLDDDSNDDELMSSTGSEETVGTTTEFDPLSMFGEELDGEDDVAEAPASTGDVATHPISTSWVEHDTTNAAATTVASYTNIPPMKDSPTGTESLGSWWQSRHALTQNSDVNSAVQEALMKRVVFETFPSTDKHDESVPEAFAGVNFGAVGVYQRGNNEPIRHPVDETGRNDDEDSIFSGLEDPMTTKANDILQAPQLPPPSVNNATPVFVRNTPVDEDVFSGVSVSSRQEHSTSQFPRLREANAMKSLLDGTSTTVDSPSFQQPPPPPLHGGCAELQIKERCSDTHCTKEANETLKQSADLFSSNAGYGVINFHKIEHSPTNASVTSDITSSVIFGGGDFRKLSFMKPLGILETTVETFDPEILVDRSAPDQPTSMLEKIEFPENLHDGLFVEITNPIRSEDQMTPPPGNGFSNLTSRGGSIVDLTPSASTTLPNGTLSHLKAQFLTKPIRQQDAENMAAEDMSQSKCPDRKAVSEAVSKTKLAFLSQLSCGAFASSSFAFCASDSLSISSPKEVEIDRNIDSKISKQTDLQLATRSNSELSVGSKASKVEQSMSNAQSTTKSIGAGLSLSNDDDEDQTNFKSSSNSTDKSESTNEDSYGAISATLDDDTYTRSESQVSSFEVASLPSRYTESRDETNSVAEMGRNLNSDARSNAYHKLLLYAYAALSVPPPSEVVEKREDTENDRVIYPPVITPHDAVVRFDEMRKMLDRLSTKGIEVLKLNRERNWQPRFLTVTKEVMWFRKSNDLRYCGIDSYPRGLLWVKKFDQDKQCSLSSITKNGQGGLLFSAIQYISLTKDNHPLSRKQKKGKFKDSVTLILHSSSNDKTREILFRCMNKDDAFALSSSFQAILDRLSDDNLKNHQIGREQLKVNVTKMESTGRHPNPKTPLVLSKAFSPRVNDDRWEL